MSTDEGALASINPRNGSYNWRVLLHSRVDVMAAMKIPVSSGSSAVFLATLSDGGKTFRGWFGSSGSLVWDHHLVDGSATTRGVDHFPRSIVALDKRWLVLSGNTVCMFDGKGTSLWSIDFSSATIQSSAKPMYFVASHLLVSGESSFGVSRLAVGCLVSDQAGRQLVCEKSAVAVVDLTVGIVKDIQTFASFQKKKGAILVSSVKAILESNADLPYKANDAIFALSADKTVEVVRPSGPSPSPLSLPSTMDGHLDMFITRDTRGMLVPAVSSCRSKAGNARFGSCESIYLFTAAASTSMVPLLSCDSGGVFSVNSEPGSSGVAASVSCVSIASPSSLLTALAVPGGQPDSHGVSASAVCALDAAGIVPVQLKSLCSGQSPSGLHQHYVVTAGGLSLLVSSDQQNAGKDTALGVAAQAKVAWSHEEALAGIAQVVIVDDNQFQALNEKASVSILSLHNRVKMQLEQTRSTVLSWVSALSAVATQLGPDLFFRPSTEAVGIAKAESFGFLKTAVCLTVATSRLDLHRITFVWCLPICLFCRFG